MPRVLLPEARRPSSPSSSDLGWRSPRVVWSVVAGSIVVLAAGAIVLGGRSNSTPAGPGPVGSTVAAASPSTAPAATLAGGVTVTLPGDQSLLDGPIGNLSANGDGTFSARPGQILTAPKPRAGTVKGWRWQRCTSATDCADIPEATKQLYTSPPTKDPMRIRAVVVAELEGGVRLELITQPFTALPEAPRPSTPTPPPPTEPQPPTEPPAPSTPPKPEGA